MKNISNLFKTYYPFILGIIVFLYILNCAFHGGDFEVYLFEAQKLKMGRSIYSSPFFKNMPYTYSVLWALILIPFTYIPNVISMFLWLMLNVYFLYNIIQISIEWLDLNSVSKSARIKILLFSFALVFRFLLYNFGMIQMTIFLVWGSLCGLDLIINKNKNLKGSFLLALVMNIKLLPLVFIPYLIYRKEIKGFLLTSSIFIFFLILPAVFIGWNFNILLLKEWWAAINPTNDHRMLGETGNGPIGLTSLIPTLLMKTSGEFPFSRNIVTLDPTIVGIILNLIRATLILFTLYFLKNPFKKAPDLIHMYWEISYIMCIIPLLAPQQQKYAFFFVFPALIYVFFYLFFNLEENFLTPTKRKLIYFLLILFFILTTLTTDGIIGRYYNEISQYYRTITYGGLILVLILAFCDPKFALFKERKLTIL